MSLLAWVGVAVAGGIGAPARFLVDSYVRDRTEGTIPWGTFSVNVIGSFLLGIIMGLTLTGQFGTTAHEVLGTGFCGAFTTFSTFSAESVRLAEEGDWRAAARYVGFSLVVGLAAAAAGLALATVL